MHNRTIKKCCSRDVNKSYTAKRFKTEEYISRLMKQKNFYTPNIFGVQGKETFINIIRKKKSMKKRFWSKEELPDKKQTQTSPKQIQKTAFKITAPLGLTLFRMGIFGAAHGWGQGGRRQKAHVSHISYNDETWCGYILTKKDPKNI